jgi:hypothetical protein
VKKVANKQPSRGSAKSKQRVSVAKSPARVDEAALLSDLRTLIQSARQRIATVANATFTLLCWQVGRRLLRENLQQGRAAYGKQILATVSQELTVEFGAGFSYTALTRMARFAEWMTDEQILASLSQELSWSHFIELLPIKDPLARDFYAEMCRIERWDVRTLRQKIGGMLYQRTALSKKPKSVIAAELTQLRDGHMTPDIVFRDPYLLDLLGLKGAYSERDLESATFPVIATTSQLMSTGVDAQTCHLIVLDKRIASMTEFKQIIGRGTRINEDYNKLFFTIMDFRQATALFADPDFDGDPVQIYEPRGDDPVVPPDDPLGALPETKNVSGERQGQALPFACCASE